LYGVYFICASVSAVEAHQYRILFVVFLKFLHLVIPSEALWGPIAPTGVDGVGGARDLLLPHVGV